MLLIVVSHASLSTSTTTPTAFSQQSLSNINQENMTSLLEAKNNNNNTRTYSGRLSRSDIPPFHWIVSGSLLGLVVVSGFIISQFARSHRSAKSSLYYWLFKRNILPASRSSVVNDLVGFTVGEMCLLVIYVACVFSWFFYGLVFERKPHTMLNKVAKGFGYATIFNFSLILMPVSRHSVWTWIFNVSYERAIRFHRMLGFSNILLLTLHAILYAAEFYRRDKFTSLFVWNKNLFIKVNILAGIISWLAMILLTILSLPFIRRHLWNTFQFCHVVLAIIVFIFGHLHLPYKLMIPFTGAGIVLYGSDVLIRYLSFATNWSVMSMSFGHHFVSVRKCEIKAHEHIGVTTAILTCDRSLILSGSDASINEGSGLLNEDPLRILEQKAKQLCLGKFINLWVWEISAWESHPFSITDVSMPDMSTIELRLDIKETGGASEAWSGQLNWLASDTDKAVSVMARFDGPFGALTIPLNQPKAVEHYDLILLFAGGIGITAVNSLTKYCAAHNPNTYLTWVVRSPEYLKLLPELLPMREHVTTYVTRGADPTRTDYIAGRPSWEKIIRRQTKSVGRCKNVAVVVCGPGSMVIDVLSACREVEVAWGTRFHIHTESFEM